MKHPLEKKNRPLRRQVYLLTCWQEWDGVTRTGTWRFSLETSRSGKREPFTMLAETMAAIELDLQRIPFPDG